MEDPNLKTTLKLSIIALFITITTFNFVGIFLELIVLYGIQQKKYKILEKSINLSFFEVLIYDFYWITYIIISITNLNTISINSLIIFLILNIQVVIQTYLTFNLNNIIKSTSSNISSNESSENSLYNVDNRNGINDEFEPLPAYTPPYKLPSYSASQATEINLSSSNDISYTIKETDDYNSSSATLCNSCSEERSESNSGQINITVEEQDITENNDNNDNINNRSPPPPYCRIQTTNFQE